LEAWEHLRSFTDRVVTFRHADGRDGFAGASPYDRIIVTAAAQDLEPAWLEQLAEGGVLLVPLVLAPGLAFIARGAVCHGEFQGRLLRAAYFMPLRAEGEAGEPEQRPWPQPAGMHSTPAPWAGWFDRKRPGSWLAFIQALVFYGLIKGLSVRQQASPAGEAIYGASDGGSICWFAANTWQVSSEAAQRLGLKLWRSFVDAGGPRPTDFTLRAIPLNTANIDPSSGVVRRGARCLQCWEQVDPTRRGPRPD
jgi:hypothetical protein